MRVTSKELREIFELLISHMESEGLSEFDIPYDYYWTVTSKDQRYDNSDRPELEMGQITEDWSWLQKYLSGETKPIGYGFVWLGEILRAIGEDHVG